MAGDALGRNSALLSVGVGDGLDRVGSIMTMKRRWHGWQWLSNGDALAWLQCGALAPENVDGERMGSGDAVGRRKVATKSS